MGVLAGVYLGFKYAVIGCRLSWYPKLSCGFEKRGMGLCFLYQSSSWCVLPESVGKAPSFETNVNFIFKNAVYRA